MKFALFILAAALATAQPREAGFITTNSTQVVPLVIVGEGWSQKIILQNVDPSATATGTIQFYTKDGAPWSVDLLTGSGSTFLINITPGQAVIFETKAKPDPQQLGWALISQTSGGSADVLGQTVFRRQADGRPDFMTSVILSDRSGSWTSTYFDNTNGNYTGMAIVTPDFCQFSFCQGDESYTVKITALDGTVLSTKAVLQKRGRLYWMNLGVDFPETNGRAGFFRVENANFRYMSAFSLQFTANGAFTAVTPYEQ